MRGAILQPTYLPWMGYFDMIDATDLYVVYDHVQFVRKSWHQRNRVKIHKGELMLSVPVKKTPQDTPICEIEIRDQSALRKHWKTISLAYGKSRYFEDYMDLFEDLYHKKYFLLRDLNVAIIKTICKIFGIRKEIIYSSELDLHKEDANLSRTWEGY